MITSKNYSTETVWRSNTAEYLSSTAITNNFSEKITNLIINTTEQTCNCIKNCLLKRKYLTSNINCKVAISNNMNYNNMEPKNNIELCNSLCSTKTDRNI